MVNIILISCFVALLLLFMVSGKAGIESRHYFSDWKLALLGLGLYVFLTGYVFFILIVTLTAMTFSIEFLSSRGML